MKNVNYKNLRRFEIGKINVNPGYLTNKNTVNTGSLNAQAGYDMSGDVSAVQKSILPTAINGINTVGNSVMNLANNYTKSAGLNATGKVTSIAGTALGTAEMIGGFSNFSDVLSPSEMQNMSATSTQSKHGINYKTYDGFNELLIKDYTDAQNKADTWKSTFGGLQAGLSAGSWGGWLGAAIGGVAGGLTGFLGSVFLGKNREKKVKENMKNTLAMQEAYNAQAESEAGSIGMRNDFYAHDGKSPGLKFSGNKYGVIQTPSGPAYGEIQGLASPDEGLIDMVTGETSYNGSKNMNVIDRRADVVPVGITGYANGGAFDNNVGIPGHMTDINGLSFADNARPLFKLNEQLKDVSAAIDMKLDENENHKTRDKATKQFIEKRLNQKKEQVQQKYQLNAQGIADIVNRQTAMTSGAYFNCGKTPRYEDGKTVSAMDLSAFKPYYGKGISIVPKIEEHKSSYIENLPEKMQLNTNNEGENNGMNINPFGASYAGLSPIYGALQSLPYAISDTLAANKYTPYAQNSYVANPTAQQALNVLGSLRYDPYRQIRQLTTAGRQNLYNINNAGSLSAGQRAALASSSNIQLAQAAMNIYDKQQEMNNALAKDYASALMGYGQDEAHRMQQANAIQQENYAKAVGAKQRLQAQARKNWYTLGRQNLQDFNTWLNTQGMLDLWNRQVAADEAKVGTKRPTATTSSVKPVKTNKYAPYAKDMGVKQRLAKKKKASAPDALPYDKAGQERKLAVPIEEFEYFPWQKPIIRPGSDLYNYHYID